MNYYIRFKNNDNLKDNPNYYCTKEFLFIRIYKKLWVDSDFYKELDCEYDPDSGQAFQSNKPILTSKNAKNY